VAEEAPAVAGRLRDGAEDLLERVKETVAAGAQAVEEAADAAQAAAAEEATEQAEAAAQARRSRRRDPRQRLRRSRKQSSRRKNKKTPAVRKLQQPGARVF
jgi:dsDNA-specific endonuclease/ATPase MutS2